MTNKLFRPLFAEFLGTFTLVFIGALAVVVAPSVNVIVPALAHGFILVALVYAYGHISGAHFNPAVTIGLLVGGKIDILKAVLYIIVQFVGGIVAALTLVAILGDQIGNYGQTTGTLTETNVWQAAGLEVILTFFLVSTVYQAAVFGKAGNLAGVAIGLSLAASIAAGGVFTGASLNPARTLGPAIVAGDMSYVLPYLVGMFAGGLIAGVINAYVLNGD